MKKENFMREFFIGLSVIIIYFVTMYSQGFVIDLLNITNYTARLIFVILYQLTVILFVMFLYQIDMRKDCKDFWNNKKQYFKTYIPYLLVSYALVGTSNALIAKFTNIDLARNQEEIMAMAGSIPVITIILAVLYAPVLEELVFRLSIKKMCGDKNILFVIISGLIFGSLHVIGFENPVWQEYLFVISYSIPGFIFAYSLVKSKNICVPMMLHFINNAIGIGAIILLGILQ